uniref:AMP-dependent synthetase/ligase domain-containing protein n=1 Tax=Parascaris equorum TaxID=6256 RepID=A0A914RQD7_PAREQ
MVMGSARSFHITELDRVYISMPLYHTAAGIIGIGQTILTGSSAAIRKKFSASNFWKDCVKYDCTNGNTVVHFTLEEEMITRMFCHRYEVDKKIATNGDETLSSVNIDGRVGSCGFLPISPLTSRLHPVRLVKVDDITGEVVRGKDGLCIPCKPVAADAVLFAAAVCEHNVSFKSVLYGESISGQTGAMVSTIRNSNLLLVFEGYLNKGETDKKVIYDVFRKGDIIKAARNLILHHKKLLEMSARDMQRASLAVITCSESVFPKLFNERYDSSLRKPFTIKNVTVLSNNPIAYDTVRDILHWDRLGYLYFKDRTGDTYRWKEAILHPMPSVADATVYGVTVPEHTDVDLLKTSGWRDEREFLQEIGDKMASSLPSYAVPIFIRACSTLHSLKFTYFTSIPLPVIAKINSSEKGCSVPSRAEDAAKIKEAQRLELHSFTASARLSR